MADDPRAGTTIEWPPYLQTFLNPTAMRVVNRSRLADQSVLVAYWENNITSPAAERSAMDSLYKEQERARQMLEMINRAVERAEECRGIGYEQ